MKIQLNSKELLERLQYLSGVVLSTNAMPILDNFLFEVEGTELKITASDLDNTMIAKMPITGDYQGSIAIPSKMLLDILKLLPSQPIEIDVQENSQVEIISISGNYSVAYYDGAEFPKTVELEEPVSISISTDALERAINKTLFACGNDDLRPVMNGVFFQLKTDSITFVSTDAHRLAKYKRTDFNSSVEVDFIVPKKPLGVIKGLLGSTSEKELEIQYNETNVAFVFGDYQLKARLVNGKYPNYEGVIPKENPNQFSINTSELVSSLKRVSIFSDRTTRQISVKRAGNKLIIAAEDKNYSSNGSETLTCEPIGNDISIGFNARFLAEALSNIDDTEVLIETSAPNRAGIIRPLTGKENEELLMLVMPVMLNS